MAAGLESGLFTPDSTFDDPGYWDGLGEAYRKTCWKKEGHGHISLVNALSASCNVTFYQVGFAENKKDVNLLPNMARAFGLGRLTGLVELDEKEGVVPDAAYKKAKGEVWYDGDAVNLSIGQGDLQVTPLQMAVAYSAIANGGTLYKPMLVTRIGSKDQGPEEVIAPQVVGKLPRQARDARRDPAGAARRDRQCRRHGQELLLWDVGQGGGQDGHRRDGQRQARCVVRGVCAL